MTTAERDLQSFASFVRERIAKGQEQLSIDELFDLWRIENPLDAQYAEDVAAIRASIEDYKRGERGTVAGEHSEQLRRAFNVTTS